MKSGFALNPDLSSMPVTFAGQYPPGMDGHWDVGGNVDTLGTNESHPRFVSVAVFPFLFFFAFVSSLFQIDTNKSITQKRLKKVPEPITILSS